MAKWGGPKEEWLRYRLDLFEKYTMRNVLAQTHEDFTWYLMYCADSVPNWVGDKLSEYEQQDSRIVPMNVNAQDYPHNCLPREMGTDMQGKNYTHFYQLRLDSDDLIHLKFLEFSIQNLGKNIKNKTALWVTYNNGFVTDGRHFTPYIWVDNAFVGVLAKVGSGLTAYAAPHGQIRAPRFEVLRHEAPGGMWAHMRHEMNLSKGSMIPAGGHDLREKFGIAPLGDSDNG